MEAYTPAAIPLFCMFRWLPCGLVSLLFAMSPAAVALPPLDTVAKIRALPPAEAAKHLPVQMEGTVLVFDPAKSSFVFYDGTGGVGVRMIRPSLDRAKIRPGARVRVEGITDPGRYFPMVFEARVTFLGMGNLPEPRHVAPGDLFSPELDSEWVEVPATILGAEHGKTGFTLVVDIQGATFKATLPPQKDSSQRAAALMQRHVRMRGVVFTIPNAQRQMTGRYFLVPSFEQIIPVEKEFLPGRVPLRRINELLRSNFDLDSPVKIRGCVTQWSPTEMYLRDDTGSTKVHTVGFGRCPLGTVVEAEGYAAVAPYRPELRAVRVEKTGEGSPPVAAPFQPREAKLPAFHDELVRVECELLACREGRHETVLQCRSGDYYFEALLPDSKIPMLHAGDRLRLDGICEITSTDPIQRGDLADGFRLLLPGSEAVAILQSAPWWTLQRVLAALGGVLALLLGFVIWNAMLRRQVATQAESIRHQIEQGHVRDERERIARELHDSVEQLLAGLSMQLDNVSYVFGGSREEAVRSLDLAQAMLRHCREETKASVSDLRNQTLLECGLAAILEDVLAREIPASGIPELEVRVEGKPRRLSATDEHHLLRIAQQAVANAVHHAGASRIRVRLVYSAGFVTLEIADEGCGFDSQRPLPPGHFGILGLRERASKIGAEFSLESGIGSGTVVRVSLKGIPPPLSSGP